MTKSFLFISLLFTLFACSNYSVKEKSVRDKKTDLYFAQGTEMLVKKDYSRALEYLLEAQKLSPKDSEIQNNLGMAYFFKKRMEKAKQHLERSIDLNPKNSDARNNYASILFREKNYQEAKKQYNAVKNDLIYPHQYRTNYNLALIEEIEGNQAQMIKLLGESVAERDDFCPAHFKLANYYFKRNELSSALKNFKKASKGTCYKDAAPLYYQAKIWLRLAAPEKSMGKLSEILSNFPASPFAKRAKTELEKIQRSNPELDEKIQLALDEYAKNELDRL